MNSLVRKMQIFGKFFHLRNQIDKMFLRSSTWLTISFFLALTTQFGCSVSANDVVEEWKLRGWVVEKIHGKQGPVKRHGQLISKSAKAVEASWIEKGNRKTKIYQQVNYHYLVLRFFKKDKDEFVVVMKKRK